MATNRHTAFPLSEKQLRKMGGLGYRFDFLKMLAVRDTALQVSDFDIKALDTTNQWTVAAGATATTWAVRAEAGGWIRGVLGTTAATSGLQISKPQKYWTPSAGAGVAILYRPSAITEIRLEMGFADALPAVNTNIVNSLTTPTFNTVASGAVFAFDHTGSTTTSGLYTIGTSGAAAAKVATTTRRPVAATPHFVAIEMVGTTAWLYCGDDDGITATAIAGVTAADGMIPFLSCKKSDTTASNVDIDMIATWSGRLG